MDDERWEPGMPVLDRQGVPDGPPIRAGASGAVAGTHPGVASPPIRPGEEHLPPSLRGLPVRSVPETKPTPLQKHFVLLSAPALILGVIAITALELGAGFDSPLVKLCVLLAAPLLLITTADATLRVGDAAAEIIEEASSWGADLLVLGSRGLTGLSRLVLGSVARNVLQGSDRSVLVVRHPADAAGATPQPEA